MPIAMAALRDARLLTMGQRLDTEVPALKLLVPDERRGGRLGGDLTADHDQLALGNRGRDSEVLLDEQDCETIRGQRLWAGLAAIALLVLLTLIVGHAAIGPAAPAFPSTSRPPARATISGIQWPAA